MKNLEEEINRVWDIAVYLQMMAAFCVDLDFNEYQLLMLEFHETIKLGYKNEISTKLYEIEKKLEFIANPLKLKYPLRNVK